MKNLSVKNLSLLTFLIFIFCNQNNEVETLSQIDNYTDIIYKVDLVTNFGNTNGTIGDLEVDLVTNFGNTNGTIGDLEVDLSD